MDLEKYKPTGNFDIKVTLENGSVMRLTQDSTLEKLKGLSIDSLYICEEVELDNE
jgi:hypothetical protein